MTTALLRYDAACRALAEAKSLDEVKDVRDKAEALRLYGRQAKNRDLEVDAAEIRLRAERRLGEMISDRKADDGLNTGGLRRGSETAPRDDRPKLADLGIDKKLSSRAQKIAAVPEARFESQMATWRDRVSHENERVTTNLIKEGEREQAKADRDERRADGGQVADLLQLATSGWKAGTILADPPWHFLTRSARGEGRSASGHYDTDMLDVIKALPVPDLAAPDSLLVVWCVDWLLQGALDVIKAWGFEYKTVGFTWAKQNPSGEGWHMGQGYWTRANPEMCLLATRGNPKRINADVRQLLVSPVTEHSRKPDEIHDRIERLVGGPYLELYARRERKGWLTWGNELAFIPPDIAIGPTCDEPFDPATGEIGAAATVLGRIVEVRYP